MGPWCAMALDCFFGLEDLGFGLGLRGGDWEVRVVEPPTDLEGRWIPRSMVSWKTSGFVGGSGLFRFNASLLVSVRVIRCRRCFLRCI